WAPGRFRWKERLAIMPEEMLTTWKPPSPPAAVKPPGTRRGWLLPVFGVILASSLGAAWWFFPRDKTAARAAESGGASGASFPSAAVMRVEVVTPEPGGLGRTVVQPGIIHAFDKAELYAKVSGYLVHQKVDIGDAVKKGDVLAEVEAPEFFR